MWGANETLNRPVREPERYRTPHRPSTAVILTQRGIALSVTNMALEADVADGRIVDLAFANARRSRAPATELDRARSAVPRRNVTRAPEIRVAAWRLNILDAEENRTRKTDWISRDDAHSVGSDDGGSVAI